MTERIACVWALVAATMWLLLVAVMLSGCGGGPRCRHGAANPTVSGDTSCRKE